MFTYAFFVHTRFLVRVVIVFLLIVLISSTIHNRNYQHSSTFAIVPKAFQ